MATDEDCRRATYALFQTRDILKNAPCCGDCDKCNLCIKVWGSNKTCIVNKIDDAADELLKSRRT